MSIKPLHLALGLGVAGVGLYLLNRKDEKKTPEPSPDTVKLKQEGQSDTVAVRKMTPEMAQAFTAAITDYAVPAVTGDNSGNAVILMARQIQPGSTTTAEERLPNIARGYAKMGFTVAVDNETVAKFMAGNLGELVTVAAVKGDNLKTAISNGYYLYLTPADAA